jgi:hypothetical protein
VAHTLVASLGESCWTTCKLCGTDLLRCSLLSFCVRTKLRHDFALKLHESSDVPVDDRAVPASLVVTISGMLVWSCNECLLIFMRLRYGIYSDFSFYCFHIYTYTFGNVVRVYAFASFIALLDFLCDYHVFEVMGVIKTLFRASTKKLFPGSFSSMSLSISVDFHFNFFPVIKYSWI